MGKINKFLIAIFSLGLISSCSFSTQSIRKKATESFAFVKVITIEKSCNDEEDGLRCQLKPAMYFGSGAIIEKNLKTKKDYILTAEHLCGHDKNALVYVNTIEGAKHKAIIVGTDEKNDLCILEIPITKHPKIEISVVEPKTGDKLLNVAAPAAVFSKNAVSVFEGIYSGINERGYAVTSIPGTHGSSGSAILNSSGKLVSVLVAMPNSENYTHITLGVPLSKIKDFIKKTLKTK